MKPPAHRDVIITVPHRPGTDPPAELLMRLNHDHGHAALGQPDRRRDTRNAATGDDDRFGRLCQPRRTRPRRMTDGASIPAGSPVGISSSDDH
jgi:hypothetical protein